MLSAGFPRPEQFLPHVQALVWDFASPIPSPPDTSPPRWFVAVSWLGDRSSTDNRSSMISVFTEVERLDRARTALLMIRRNVSFGSLWSTSAHHSRETSINERAAIDALP